MDSRAADVVLVLFEDEFSLEPEAASTEDLVDDTVVESGLDAVDVVYEVEEGLGLVKEDEDAETAEELEALNTT